MLKFKKEIPLWIVLLVGFFCSMMMLGGRLNAEDQDREVSAAICYDDVLLLAQDQGMSPENWMNSLQKSGVYYLVVTDQNEAEGKRFAEKMDMRIARAGNCAKAGDAFLMPPVDDYEAISYDAPFGDASVPLALVENPWRTGVVMPKDFDPDQWNGPMVKTLYMIDGYRYHYERTEPFTENENILFRAVVERGSRLLILTPLIHEGDESVVSEAEAYTDILDGLSQRIRQRGLVLGEAFSAMDAPTMNPLLFGGSLLLLVATVVWLLKQLVSLPQVLEWLLLFGGGAAALLGSFVLPDLMQKGGAFGASIIFPFIALMLLIDIANGKSCFLRIEKNFLRFVVTLFAVVGIGILGGLYISALLSTRAYMLQFSVFSGVKLSQLLPVGLAAIWFGYTLFNRKARAKRTERRLPLPLLIVMGVALVGVLIVLILRSGDNMLPVSNLEIQIRNWLEYTLYARPRTKEMLLAFPAVALYIVASKRGYPLLQLPLGVLASVGAASIANTFCHTFTPVRVSLIRTLFSTTIGLLIGLVAMWIFDWLLGKGKRKI